MKAAVIDCYGESGVIQIAELPEPTVKEHDLLIRTFAAGVNPVDWQFRSGARNGRLSGKFPKILGVDTSGVVEDVGPAVTQFSKGDFVMACVPVSEAGTYAEFVVVDAGLVCKKPATLSYSEAAALPFAGLTAYQALVSHAEVSNNDQVLIIGAGGGVGHLAVQIARYYGARVTAVCSEKSMPMVSTLQPDRMIDYASTDYLKDGTRYTLILDTVGVIGPFTAFSRLLKHGRFVFTNPRWAMLGYHYWSKVLNTLGGSKTSHRMRVCPNASDLEQLAGMADEGAVKPQIDRVFQLDESRDAHRYGELGHTIGKSVIITRDFSQSHQASLD